MEALFFFDSYFNESFYLEVSFSKGKIKGSVLREGCRNSGADLGDYSILGSKIVSRLKGEEGVLGINDFDLREMTVFNRDVLSALFYTSPGQRLSYSDLAAKIGRPGSSRAVATKCANNPFHLLIPCHRVVLKSGELGAYSAVGGPATKLKILDYELAISSSSF